MLTILFYIYLGSIFLYGLILLRSYPNIKEVVEKSHEAGSTVKRRTLVNVLWAIGLVPILNTWLCISYMFRIKPFGDYDPDQITEE